jgi:hypothetical protein
MPLLACHYQLSRNRTDNASHTRNMAILPGYTEPHPGVGRNHYSGDGVVLHYLDHTIPALDDSTTQNEVAFCDQVCDDNGHYAGNGNLDLLSSWWLRRYLGRESNSFRFNKVVVDYVVN